MTHSVPCFFFQRDILSQTGLFFCSTAPCDLRATRPFVMGDFCDFLRDLFVLLGAHNCDENFVSVNQEIGCVCFFPRKTIFF